MIKSIRIIVFALLILMVVQAHSYGQSTRIKKVVLQGFWWDYRHDAFDGSWSDYLTTLAPRLKSLGIDAIWVPPSYKNQSPTWVGYGPMDHYDLGDKFQKGNPNINTALGTKDEFLRMIAVMHANGIEVIQDIVLNHVDGAGSQQGNGGIDNHPSSLATNNGYKNFRYVSFTTPAIDESEDDYFTRNGRWPKNYANFYPNASNACCTNDVNSPYFGPDISYESNGIGQSSSIPTSGKPTGYPDSRPFINFSQPSNYMLNEARNWIMWYKKQTGVDGFRWDAVKHFPISVQEDLIYNTKYSLPSWSKGGQTMLNIGEWIGSKSDIDGYVDAVATGCAPTGDTNNNCELGYGREEHTGTFDFSLRGYGSTGGLYSMVRSSGGYDVSNLPGEQQNKRYFDYGSLDTRVHRSFSFVNSHDTYRPILTANGDFSVSLSNSYSSGWNTGGELGGNGGHLDPREPRMAAAYATTIAMDGNVMVFFEDIFDIGTTGMRWTHDPLDNAELPVINDLGNLLQAHGKLDFAQGDYFVRTAETLPVAPYHQTGVLSDHIVFERSGKAIIGITDSYSSVADNSMDQEVWISTSFPIGTNLYDYSGAHGTSFVTVTDHFGNQNIHRVLIKTAPAGHQITGAFGHGYSIWAPAPVGVTINSVQDLYDHLSTYAPARNAETIQEWEMEDDLGDSHCQSLGQGGRLPGSSVGQRVAGKIFVEGGTSISLDISPTDANQSITAYIANREGVVLKKVEGLGSLTTSFIVPSTDWYVIKIRNTTAANPGQKCFVRVTYEGPEAVVDAVLNAATNTGYIWTGNNGNQDWSDCRNWEEGRIPSNSDDVHIPELVDNYPILPSGYSGQLLIEPGSTPLASDVIGLKLSPQKDGLLLQWTMANHLSPSKYILERSVDDGLFIQIFETEQSNRQGITEYLDSDIEPKETYYYKVRMQTEGGEVHVSNIVKGTLEDELDNMLELMPNPTTGPLKISLKKDLSGLAKLQIFDIHGKLVFKSALETSVINIDCTAFLPGTYLISIETESELIKNKFIKI